MKIHSITLSGVVFLVVTALTHTTSWGQVDGAWLKNWTEAKESQPAALSSSGTIASKNEPGVPLIIHGIVLGPDKKPASGVIVHSYQRDHHGFEFGLQDKAFTTWRLQGWAMSDESGRFEFETIRPAADHLGREGAHIHFTMESSEYGRQWAPKVFFSDDPLVTADQRERSKKAGEFGWIRAVKTIDDIQHIEVRIQLKEKADF